MGCTNYNCTDILPQVLNTCGELVEGGFDQAVIFDCDATTTDYTNGTEVAADITAGRAVIYKNIKSGIDAPSANEIDVMVAGQEPRAVNYSRTATWVDANVNTSSSAAYDTLDATSGITVKAILFHLASGENTILVDPPKGCIFKGGLIVPNDVSDAARYEYTASWKDPNSPSVKAVPSGVFA